MRERRHTTLSALIARDPGREDGAGKRTGRAAQGSSAALAPVNSFAPPARGAGVVIFALGVLGCDGGTSIARAQSLVRRGEDAQAVEVLRTQLRTAPSDRAARRLLILVLAASGDLVAARVEIDALGTHLPPGDPSASIELGHALELAHRFDEALDAYDQAAAVAPASPVGPREGGLRTAHWGEVDLARPRLEQAVRRGADDAEVWHTLGLVRLRMGDLDGAEQAYRRGTRQAPQAAESWIGLASVALTRGDAAAALDAYNQVLARKPRFAAAALGRAWALARLGRDDEARRALDRAEQLGAPPAYVARQRAALQR